MKTDCLADSQTLMRSRRDMALRSRGVRLRRHCRMRVSSGDSFVRPARPHKTPWSLAFELEHCPDTLKVYNYCELALWISSGGRSSDTSSDESSKAVGCAWQTTSSGALADRLAYVCASICMHCGSVMCRTRIRRRPHVPPLRSPICRPSVMMPEEDTCSNT